MDSKDTLSFFLLCLSLQWLLNLQSFVLYKESRDVRVELSVITSEANRNRKTAVNRDKYGLISVNRDQGNLQNLPLAGRFGRRCCIS